MTAWLVYEIGRRVLGPRWRTRRGGDRDANPYLAWHDMHVNREIVDQVCAAALVLLTLIIAERPSKKLAALLGVVTGLAMLGNTRLVFLPVLCAGYLAWRLPRVRARPPGSPRSCSAAPPSPSRRGSCATRCSSAAGRSRPTAAPCGRRTTSRRTALLSSGQWIDNVSHSSPRPKPPNRDTPEEAWGYLREGPARRRLPRLSERVRRRCRSTSTRRSSTGGTTPGTRRS